MHLAVNTPLMFCHSLLCKSVWRAEDVQSPESPLAASSIDAESKNCMGVVFQAVLCAKASV